MNNKDNKNRLMRTNLNNICPNYLNDMMHLKDAFCSTYEPRFNIDSKGRVDVDAPPANNNRGFRYE